MDKEVMPYLSEWEKAGKVPADLYKKFGELGVLACIAGGKTWPNLPGYPKPPCGIQPEDWDTFHSLVIGDEIARCASAGIAATFTLGNAFSVVPSFATLRSPVFHIDLRTFHRFTACGSFWL